MNSGRKSPPPFAMGRPGIGTRARWFVHAADAPAVRSTIIAAIEGANARRTWVRTARDVEPHSGQRSGEARRSYPQLAQAPRRARRNVRTRLARARSGAIARRTTGSQEGMT